jgi:hypothetical protein
MNIEDLNLGTNPKALEFPHFPTRWQAIIWRNWGLVSIAKIAEILQTNESEIINSAEEMGLAVPAKIDEQWLERGYLTIIRNNWHLMPYSQLLQLLEWDADKLDYILREDDFLWHKLGFLKPDIEPVKWQALSDDQKKQTAWIKAIVQNNFSELKEIEKPFDFIENYSKNNIECVQDGSDPFELKFIYSYHAVYGDSLLKPELDPYPENLLEKYSRLGINGIWLQAILYTLFPLEKAPEFSIECETRLHNLKRLVEKAKKYGIKIYLYLNEPRGMPERFFEKYPDWKGVDSGSGIHTLCTSNPEVLKYLEKSISYVFENVEDLGGLFCITMSENPTHCYSRGKGKECQKCSSRSVPEVIAEVISAMERGVHIVAPEAKVMAHSWAWSTEWERELVSLLPEKVELLSVSEWGQKFNIGGIEDSVKDYSMSVIGPSEEKMKLWETGKKYNLKSVAKVQLNNSWECSAVPYIPVPYLVKEHLNRLAAEKIDSLMLSWTLGGYPSWNLELIRKTPEELAIEKLGEKAANKICEAWKIFGEAFKEFPFHIHVLYKAPQNYGPINLFYAKATNYKSTMIGYPYDDLDGWRDIYPEDIFEQQFEKLSKKWASGLKVLKASKTSVPKDKLFNYLDLENVSVATYCHFKSSYNIIKFVRLRNSGKIDKIIKILDDEINITKQLLEIILRDSRIGFEASNHYYYTQNDLKEKILNCEYLKEYYSEN